MSRRIITITLAVLITLTGTVPCYAQRWYEETPYGGGEALEAAALPAVDFALDCKAAILMEPVTGRVIYEKSPDVRMPEASITKVMTALLVFEALDAGSITMQDEVTCSEYAASMGGSQIWLEPGEVMTVHDLIKACMVGSANDASVVLAEYIGGSHESFVAMMNQRAAELGLENTAFKNCTGLDADGHVSTARDIAVMSAELMRHEGVFEFSTIWQDSLRGGATQLVNTNKLVRWYDGINGLKTGTTSQAGCCVSACAKRDGMQLIAVIMGAPNSKTRFSCASKLLDYGFAACELVELENIAVSTSDIAVTGGMDKTIGTETDMTGSVLVPKGRSGDIQTVVEMAEDIEAPVEYGQTVGTVTLTLDGETLCSCNILTSASTDEVTFHSAFALLWNALLESGD